MKIRLFLLCFVVLMLACHSSKEEKLNDYMVGSWQTSCIKVEMPTAYGKDSLKVFEDDFSKENATLAQSTYKKDGTFSAWYLMPDGKKSGEFNGKWYTKNDSLYIEYMFGGKLSKPAYHIKKTANGFEGNSIYDWDGDGENDDTLLMKSKKIQSK